MDWEKEGGVFVLGAVLQLVQNESYGGGDIMVRRQAEEIVYLSNQKKKSWHVERGQLRE